MRKYILSMFVILLLITSIVSMTYAWFTYVDKKSLATFEAGVLSVSFFHDQMTVNENMVMDELAFIDYQKDFIDQTEDMLNIMASVHRIDIVLGDESPQASTLIEFIEPEDQTGFLYIVIYEGLNLEEGAPLTSNYQSIINTVIAGETTKEEQYAAIKAYNDSVLLEISEAEIGMSSALTFQIICWGVYDDLADQENYLDTVFELQMNILIINSKGAGLDD